MERPPLDMEQVRRLLGAVRENDLTLEQAAELDALVKADPEVRQHVARSMYLHAALLWRGNGLAPESPAAESPGAVRTKPTGPPRSRSLGSVLQHGWDIVTHPSERPVLSVALASLAVAVVVAPFLVPAWFHEPAIPLHEPGVVARLNRVDGAVWPDQQSLLPGARVFAGDRLYISGGLIELQFYSGAQMIVEGPAVVNVNAADICQLESGGVTVQVPPRAKGFRVESREVIVVDLGTEFGMRRTSQGTEVHVFQGEIEALAPSISAKTGRTMSAGESAMFSGKQFTQLAAPPRQFVRSMPSVKAPAVWGTGQGLQHGNIDPHWKISAISSRPDFQPQQAVVANRQRGYLIADPDRGNWISLASDLPKVAGKCYYTFSTDFDLTGFDPAITRLWGTFSVDNQVHAIRINGESVAVPRHSTGGFAERYEFHIDKGFRAGMNRLEFVVYNGHKKSPSPMALLVELYSESR